MAAPQQMKPGPFRVALHAAQVQAANVHGPAWYLVPGVASWGRVPASYGSPGTRCFRIPAARYWPQGKAPTGIDCAPLVRPEVALAEYRKRLPAIARAWS